MVDAPEKIWIEQDDCPYFYFESELSEVGSPVTEYTRSDLVAELKAENERLKHALEAANKRADTTSPVAEAVAAEPVDYPRILYVCEHCQENAPEMCGRSRDDLYVTPSGQWLCDECREEEGVPISDCVSPPALYPAPTSGKVTEAELENVAITLFDLSWFIDDAPASENGERIGNTTWTTFESGVASALADPDKYLVGARMRFHDLLSEQERKRWMMLARAALKVASQDDRGKAQGEREMSGIEDLAFVEEVRSVLGELVDLMEDVISGDYKPDSFTCQPARELLAKMGLGAEDDPL